MAMFPPGSASTGYGQEGGQNLLSGSMGSMYSAHGHSHMLPAAYNSYSAQLAAQPTAPTPTMWQPGTTHTVLSPSTPSAPDQTFTSSLSFNSSREPYLQSPPQGLQSPISPYQTYGPMNHGVWRHYDMGLQGITSKYRF